MNNSVSIIVPTYNRNKYLRTCISALLNQEFDNFEVIVVNDGSSDGTREYLNNLNNKKVKIIHNEKNLGISNSRNKAIKLAKHELVVFTDDDCVADKYWLKNLVVGFENEKVGLVMGQTFYIKKNYKGYFPERLVQNINARWPMGNNVMYRKKVFKESGYFNPLFFKYNNEDTEMAIRAVANGFEFRRAKDAIVYHRQINWTPRSLIKSAKNSSVWVLLKKKYPEYYLSFGGNVKFGLLIEWRDYVYFILLPVLIPILLMRYLIHGKKNIILFFVKWPVLLILKRIYIFKEAIVNKILMF